MLKAATPQSSGDLWRRAYTLSSELRDLHEEAYLTQDAELHKELKAMIRNSGVLRERNSIGVEGALERREARRAELDRLKAERRVAAHHQQRVEAVERREQAVADRETAAVVDREVYVPVVRKRVFVGGAGLALAADLILRSIF